MPRLLKRQEPPAHGAVAHAVPTCIACGNRRSFWVRRGAATILVVAWALEPADAIIGCGHCRSHHSLLFGWSDE